MIFQELSIYIFLKTTSTNRWFSVAWAPDPCANPLPVACYHGDAGVDLADVASVCIGRAVSAHLGSAAASVPHQKEAKDGGNIQAQRRGEEADESGGGRKARAAPTAAQRRTPHMIPCVETLNCRIEAPPFPHLDVIFLFCTRIRLDWTSSFEAFNMRKLCIIHLPAVLHYHNKY